MNLGSLKTALKRYGFNDADPLTDWINAALHEFEDAYPWPWLEKEVFLALLTGENEITLPADFYKLQSVKFKGFELRPKYLGYDVFTDEIADRTVTGSLPTVFTLIGMDTMPVWPVPTQDLDLILLYRRSVDDLVDDTDIPNIPTRHHYGLVAGAATYALQAENEEDRAVTAANLWQSVIDRAIARYATRQEMEPDQVRDSAGYFEPELNYAPYRRP